MEGEEEEEVEGAFSRGETGEFPVGDLVALSAARMANASSFCSGEKDCMMVVISLLFLRELLGLYERGGGDRRGNENRGLLSIVCCTDYVVWKFMYRRFNRVSDRLQDTSNNDLYYKEKKSWGSVEKP